MTNTAYYGYNFTPAAWDSVIIVYFRACSGIVASKNEYLPVLG